MYKVVPEIIEKPVPYTVEKPYKVEIEKPFPVEVVRKIEIPVPKPYPVHVVYYKHISEDDALNHKGQYPSSPSVSYSSQQSQNTPSFSISPSKPLGIQSYIEETPQYSSGDSHEPSYLKRKPSQSIREYSNRIPTNNNAGVYTEKRPKHYNLEYAGEITPNHNRDHHQQRNDKFLYSGY